MFPFHYIYKTWGGLYSNLLVIGHHSTGSGTRGAINFTGKHFNMLEVLKYIGPSEE